MFGLDHSYSAEKTLAVLKENNLSNIVELGAGLGRDTIFFGKNSINVTALDYSKKGISIIDKKINDQNLNSSIRHSYLCSRNFSKQIFHFYYFVNFLFQNYYYYYYY